MQKCDVCCNNVTSLTVLSVTDGFISALCCECKIEETILNIICSPDTSKTKENTNYTTALPAPTPLLLRTH